jgi:putative ABC transport system substrate-binding protein
MRRREFIAGVGGTAAVWPLAARAQKSMPRIGWLVYGGATLGPIDQSLKDAIAQAGLIDGRSIEIVFRYANGKPDQLAGLADELVAQKPDLLLAVGGDVIKPLFEASKGRSARIGTRCPRRIGSPTMTSPSLAMPTPSSASCTAVSLLSVITRGAISA